jgi:hypothetical protein
MDGRVCQNDGTHIDMDGRVCQNCGTHRLLNSTPPSSVQQRASVLLARPESNGLHASQHMSGITFRPSLWSSSQEFLAGNPEFLGSIPGVTKFPA